MNMLKEFGEFAMKGNVVDPAIGITCPNCTPELNGR
jgi:large-conductance mechanosensitive channel